MTGPSNDEDDKSASDLARAIREIVGDQDRPLTREEAKELAALKAQLSRPSRKAVRDLGRRLARPEEP